MNLSEILSNPVRIRIVQYLQSKEQATTRQMSEAMPDIPTPSLYRHINYLLKENVLLVVEERKVRGTTERMIAFNKSVWEDNVNSNLSDTAYQFLMSLFAMFQEYDQGTKDPAEDRLSMRTFSVRLTDETFDRFFSDLKDLMGRYQEDEPEGKLRSISFISAPMKEEE